MASKPRLAYMYSTGRSGTNIIYDSIKYHFKETNYNIVNWPADVYDVTEKFNETQILSLLNTNTDTFLLTHCDVTNSVLDKIFTNYELELITLQRRKSFDWFLTSHFNYLFLNKLLPSNSKVIFDEETNNKIYKELLTQLPDQPLTIAYDHMIPIIEIYIEYLSKKKQLKDRAVNHRELFFEDIVSDPAGCLNQFGFTFRKEKATIKFHKPAYSDIFDNIHNAEIMWYSLLNKRLKIAGLTE